MYIEKYIQYQFNTWRGETKKGIHWCKKTQNFVKSRLLFSLHCFESPWCHPHPTTLWTNCVDCNKSLVGESLDISSLPQNDLQHPSLWLFSIGVQTESQKVSLWVAQNTFVCSSKSLSAGSHNGRTYRTCHTSPKKLRNHNSAACRNLTNSCRVVRICQDGVYSRRLMGKNMWILQNPLNSQWFLLLNKFPPFCWWLYGWGLEEVLILRCINFKYQQINVFCAVLVIFCGKASKFMHRPGNISSLLRYKTMEFWRVDSKEVMMNTSSTQLDYCI